MKPIITVKIVRTSLSLILGVGLGVTGLAQTPASVTVTGPGLVEVTAWRQASSMTVHLVNLTNPMMMKGPLRELLPVSAQRVRVTLPRGTRATRVTLLSSGTSPVTTRDGASLTVQVPSILDHEVVAIDLA